MQERNANIVVALIIVLLVTILLFVIFHDRTKRKMNANLDRLVKETTLNLDRHHNVQYELHRRRQIYLLRIASQFKPPLATLKGICYVGRLDPNSNFHGPDLERIEKSATEIEQMIESLDKLNFGVHDGNHMR
jgi:hypothetical protein